MNVILLPLTVADNPVGGLLRALISTPVVSADAKALSVAGIRKYTVRDLPVQPKAANATAFSLMVAA
ncbi:MAG: hypothetical protein LBK23_02230, partial [Oscillospiraceae bacterium]|nr:hypothetical protein [Oscillospiraceae bacterium]